MRKNPLSARTATIAGLLILLLAEGLSTGTAQAQTSQAPQPESIQSKGEALPESPAKSLPEALPVSLPTSSPQSIPKSQPEALPKSQSESLPKSPQQSLPESSPEAAKNSGQHRQTCTKYKIADLHVAVWKPLTRGKAPLVIFSHGSGGKNTQSKRIMQALAQAGYLVIAPNHKDSTITGISLRPDFTYPKASRWSDTSFESRRKDIVKLIAALHSDPDWDQQIDWSNLALCGHSLGGYTILGLCGAWPSWKIDGVKAALGFSPYCEPFLEHGNLSDMKVPVMYQGGTKDKITRSVEGPGGAYSQTSSPAYFVEFDRARHLAWTNFNHNKKKQALIDYYSLAFLDKYLKGLTDSKLETKLDGVAVLEEK